MSTRMNLPRGLAALALVAGCTTAAGIPADGTEQLVSLAATEGPLSSEEAADLAFLREEEKLARDVYRALGEVWDVPQFANIAASEERHMAAVLGRLDAYGLEDPARADDGAFVNPTLAALYPQLVAAGKTSLAAAYAVGAEIEELDLADLANLRAHTTRSDLLAVYDALARGSRNHLRAFAAGLADEGATYTPKHLAQDAYDAIVSSDMERGSGRGGRGGRGRGGAGAGGGRGDCPCHGGEAGGGSGTGGGTQTQQQGERW